MADSPKQLTGDELARELVGVGHPVVVHVPGFAPVAVTGANLEANRVVLTTHPMNKVQDDSDNGPDVVAGDRRQATTPKTP